MNVFIHENFPIYGIPMESATILNNIESMMLLEFRNHRAGITELWKELLESYSRSVILRNTKPVNFVKYRSLIT